MAGHGSYTKLLLQSRGDRKKEGKKSGLVL